MTAPTHFFCSREAFKHISASQQTIGNKQKLMHRRINLPCRTHGTNKINLPCPFCTHATNKSSYLAIYICNTYKSTFLAELMAPTKSTYLALAVLMPPTNHPTLPCHIHYTYKSNFLAILMAPTKINLPCQTLRSLARTIDTVLELSIYIVFHDNR